MQIRVSMVHPDGTEDSVDAEIADIKAMDREQIMHMYFEPMIAALLDNMDTAKL